MCIQRSASHRGFAAGHTWPAVLEHLPRWDYNRSSLKTNLFWHVHAQSAAASFCPHFDKAPISFVCLGASCFCWHWYSSSILVRNWKWLAIVTLRDAPPSSRLGSTGMAPRPTGMSPPCLEDCWSSSLWLCFQYKKHHHVKQILAIPGWMEWKPLNDFMRGISGNMGLSESQFECALTEVKYYMEFGKMPSVEDLAPEHFWNLSACTAKRQKGHCRAPSSQPVQAQWPIANGGFQAASLCRLNS